MSHLPEVAQASGLEVDHAVSAPTSNGYYAAQQQYVEQPHHGPSKNEYIPVGEQIHAAGSSPGLICGVRRSTFWLAVILAIVVIAAAVGGGVGGSIAVSNARYVAIFLSLDTSFEHIHSPSFYASHHLHPPATDQHRSQSEANTNNSPTETTPSPTTARETITVTPSACTPSPSSTDIYTPSLPIDVRRIDNSCPQTLFSQFGSDKIEYTCKDHKDYGGFDIMWFTAYTWQACIDGCTSFNRRNATEVKCRGVALGEDLQHQAVVNNGANCWLKTEVDEGGLGDAEFVSVAWVVGDV